jgi:hypothetical protein
MLFKKIKRNSMVSLAYPQIKIFNQCLTVKKTLLKI